MKNNLVFGITLVVLAVVGIIACTKESTISNKVGYVIPVYPDELCKESVVLYEESTRDLAELSERELDPCCRATFINMFQNAQGLIFVTATFRNPAESNVNMRYVFDLIDVATGNPIPGTGSVISPSQSGACSNLGLTVGITPLGVLVEPGCLFDRRVRVRAQKRISGVWTDCSTSFGPVLGASC